MEQRTTEWELCIKIVAEMDIGLHTNFLVFFVVWLRIKLLTHCVRMHRAKQRTAIKEQKWQSCK